ncbi:MAG: hypothetical protein U0075_21260 [Thermomicrobiales bacterium]
MQPWLILAIVLLADIVDFLLDATITTSSPRRPSRSRSGVARA